MSGWNLLGDRTGRVAKLVLSALLTIVGSATADGEFPCGGADKANNRWARQARTNTVGKDGRLRYQTSVSGVAHVLVLAGKYSDTGTDPYSPAQLEDRLFTPDSAGTDTAFRSATDYYTEVSRGAFTFEGTVIGNASGGLQQIGYAKSAFSGSTASIKLYVDAVLDSADAHIDFNDYDTDDDGVVELVTFVHPGGEHDPFHSAFLSYAGHWGGGGYATDDLHAGQPVRVNEIIIAPLVAPWDDPNDSDSANDLMDIGTYVHEFGHFLGLPDRYPQAPRYRTSGLWSVMGEGAWGATGTVGSGVPYYGYRNLLFDYKRHDNRPTHLDPLSKMQLGWANVTTIDEPQTGVELAPVLDDGDIVLVDAGLPDDEFWLLEYREARAGTFDQDLPNNGLLIWHAKGDEVHLEEADGANRLLNNPFFWFGDHGDVYPGSATQRVFDDFRPSAYISSPPPNTANSRSESGQWTGLAVTNITMGPDGDYVSFDVLPSASEPWTGLHAMTNPVAPGFYRAVALADADANGRLDIYQASGRYLVPPDSVVDGTDRLWSQTGPSSYVTGAIATDRHDTRSASWADYDNDGKPDLYIVENHVDEAVMPKNRLYRNLGTSFQQRESVVGVNQGGSGRGAAWLDFNADGLTDLLVVRSDSASLFRNTGAGTVWPNEAVSRGLVIADGSGATCADYDGDGWIDVWVGRDGGGGVASGALFRNSGPPSFNFTNVTTSAGLTGTGSSLASAWADYDNDGDQDLYVSCFVDTVGTHQNRLYRNSGGSFTNIASTAGVTATGVARMRGVVWSDVDNDADLDLLVAAKNRIHEFRNQGASGSFVFTEVPGIRDLTSLAPHGLATGDIDGDGSGDLVFNNAATTTYVYERTEATGNHWLQVTLAGANDSSLVSCYSNRSAIGAKVRVVSGGVTQWRQVEGGLGSGSQNSLTLQFGLGSATSIDLVEVTWPSGIVQPVSASIDTAITLTEPTTFHGTITQNTTWSGCLTVDGDVKVNTGVTLTIAAGTDVRFATTDAANLGSFSSQCELLVYGTLEVDGTATLPVTLASAAGSPTEDDWAGVMVYGTANLTGSELRHSEWGLNTGTSAGPLTVDGCLFESNLVADLRLYGSDAEVSNTTINIGGGGGIEAVGDELVFTDLTITGDTTSTYGAKLTSSTSEATFDGNTISGLATGYGIWLDAGTSVLTGNQISGCHNAVRVANGTHTIGASGDGNDLSGGYYGIYAACTGPGSCPSGCTMAVTVRHNSIHDNTVGVNVRKTYAGVDLGTATSLGNNSIVDNSLYCIQNSSTCGTVAARGNYFGECDPLPPLCTDGAVDIADYLCSPPSAPGAGTVDVAVPMAPRATVLLANVPNPFDPETRVRFLLAHEAPVVLEILDAAGRRVERANLGTLPAGEHSWIWRGRNSSGAPLPGGMYFARLRAGAVVRDRKMIMLK